MYETYYDKLQPYFGQENIQLHYIDTDAFVLSVKTNDFIRDLKNLEDIFNFSNLDQNHVIFSNINKQLIGFFKIEIPKSIWIDEFVCLRSKMYLLKCRDDNKKLKGISKSQSKHNKFEEYYNCLFGGEYQKECDNYYIRSINHKCIFKK